MHFRRQCINLYHFHHISEWSRFLIRHLYPPNMSVKRTTCLPSPPLRLLLLLPSLLSHYPQFSSHTLLSFLASNFLFIISPLSFPCRRRSEDTLSSSSNSPLLHLPSLVQSLSSSSHHSLQCLSHLPVLVASSLWNIDQASLPTCTSSLKIAKLNLGEHVNPGVCGSEHLNILPPFFLFFFF